MKKIVGLLLSVILALGIFGGAAFAQETKAELPEREFELLSRLGIYSGEYDVNSYMTRGEYAALLLSLLNQQPTDMGHSRYQDVSNNRAAIETVSDLKIMVGVGDGRFEPDERVTYEQAATALVRILGYDPVVKSGENTYWGQAHALKLLSGIQGISTYEKARTVVVLAMIYNALDTEMMERIYAEGKENYRINSDKTLLSEYFQVYTAKGVVTANGETSLQTPQGMRSDEIKIENTVYKNTDAYTADSLGYNIMAFYQENGEEKTILYSVRERNKEFSLRSSEIERFEDNKFYTRPQDREISYKISHNADIIYNNRGYAGSMSGFSMQPRYGSVSGIDNNGDGIYDVLKIEDYQVFVAQTVTEDGIYVQDGEKTEIRPQDYENIQIVDKDGYLVQQESIVQWDALFVAESADKQCCKIIVSQDKAFGNVTGIKGNVKAVGSEGRTIAIDGKSYPLSGQYFAADGKLPDLEFEGGFVLDLYDEIIFSYQLTSSYDQYAYLIDAVLSQESFESKLHLKMYTEKGKMEVFTVQDGIEIDGVRYKKAEQAYSALLSPEAETVSRQIVRFRTDKAGVLSKLDLSSNTQDEDGIHQYYKKTSAAYKAAASGFEAKLLIDGTSRVFIVPETESVREEDYSIVTKSHFSNDKSYNVEGYRVGEKDGTANVVVCFEKAAQIKGNERPALVTDISLTLNEQGDEVYSVSMLYGGNAVVYETRDKEVFGDDIPECGDVIRFNLNNAKQIIIGAIIYDESNDSFKLNTNFTNTAYNVNSRIAYASVYAKNGRILTLTAQEPSESYPADAQMYFGNVFSIYVYDRQMQTAKKGTYDDVVDYLSAGTACSKAIVHTEWGDPKTLIVYR